MNGSHTQTINFSPYGVKFPPGRKGLRQGGKVYTRVERFAPGRKGLHPGGKVCAWAERFAPGRKGLHPAEMGVGGGGLTTR